MKNLKFLHLKYKNYIKNKYNHEVDFIEFLEVIKENNFINFHVNDMIYFFKACNVSNDLITNAIIEL